MTQASAKRVVIRTGLLALLLALPGGSAFAFAETDATLKVSGLIIAPDSGALSILDFLEGSPVWPLVVPRLPKPWALGV